MTRRFRPSLHPIRFVDELRSEYGPNLDLNFSRYLYRPRHREDRRESFSVRIGKVTNKWLLRELERLEVGQELALESRVRIGAVTHHIPMLDFVGMSRGQLTAVMEIFPRYAIHDAHVYFSGRSFHAYFPVLLSRKEWVRFMGSALLCNTREHPRVVDQRWVGHRLMGGYGALRWSWNSKAYKAMPRKTDATWLDVAAQAKRRLVADQ